MRVLFKCAARFFHPADNKVVYDITSRDLLVLRDAPDWIADTILFNWMLKDGSIEVVNLTASQKKLENDPVQGAHADGKKVIDKEPEDVSEAFVKEEVNNATERVQKPARGRKAKESTLRDDVL